MDAAPDAAERPIRPISCTIIVKDEEDRIARCLASVRGLVSEIVVVDSGSTDSTIEICRSFGARCFDNPWQGYGQQKRFAEDQARHDWILNLDADEWLPERARAELLDLLGRDAPEGIHGYEFKIDHVYPGHETPRFLADYHRYIRLYDKRHCRFPDSAVFDEIKLPKGRFLRLRTPIYHQSIRSVSHLVRKNVAYYKLQRGEIRKNVFVNTLRLLIEPVTTFVKYYLFRRHITGGAYGLVLASTIAGLRTYRLMLLMRRPSSVLDAARKRA